MSSEILRGDRLLEALPMPWMAFGDERTAPGVSGVRAASAESYPHGTSAREIEARLAAAQTAAERSAREAREAGRREGEAAARQAAQGEIQRMTEQVAVAIRQIADLRARLRLEAEADLVRLALEIARRVVRRELSIDPEAIGGLVRTALERLRLQETVSARVHPGFVDAVRQHLARSPGAGHLEIIGDPTLERGGVVFETTRGRLDASAETQLAEIERGLTDRLREYAV